MMKRTFVAATLTFTCTLSVLAQKQTNGKVQASGESSASAKKENKSLNLQSGTMISGQLQNMLDVRKAKVGDQVVLRTTNSIKEGGQTLVNKGARLVGRVTAVESKTRANGQSRIGVLFDRLDRFDAQLAG